MKSVIFALMALSYAAPQAFAANETCQAGCELSYRKCVKKADLDLDRIDECQNTKDQCIEDCNRRIAADIEIWLSGAENSQPTNQAE